MLVEIIKKIWNYNLNSARGRNTSHILYYHLADVLPFFSDITSYHCGFDRYVVHLLLKRYFKTGESVIAIQSFSFSFHAPDRKSILLRVENFRATGAALKRAPTWKTLKYSNLRVMENFGNVYNRISRIEASIWNYCKL